MSSRSLTGPACYLILGLLAGCTQVSFQHPPEPLSVCDERLVGSWEAAMDDPEPGERVFVRIEQHCERWLALELDGQGPPKVDDLARQRQLRFAQLDRGAQDADAVEGILVVTEHGDDTAADDPESAAVDSDEPQGHLLLRYRLVGSDLQLWHVDARQVAHRIIDNELPGWVDKRDRKADDSGNVLDRRFRVHVFADVPSTRQLLSDVSIWEREPWLRLRRIVDPAALAELQYWLTQAQPDPKLLR